MRHLWSRRLQQSDHRFCCLSLSCDSMYRRIKSEFSTLEIKQHSYTAILDAFTPKTYILIVSTDRNIRRFTSTTFINASKLIGSLHHRSASPCVRFALSSETQAVKAAIDKAKPVFGSLPGVSLAGR